MRKMAVLLGFCLTLPASAAAAPITSGIWSPVVSTSNNGAIFWDNLSVDCFVCNAGTILDIIYGPIEYLHDGSGGATQFSFSEAVSPTQVSSLTLLKNYTFTQQADGSFTYNNGLGFVSNSLGSNWDQFALFRQVSTQGTRYFLAIEDLDITPIRLPLLGLVTLSDKDYNDYIGSFYIDNPVPPIDTVPEPSTLMLMGTALAVVSRRFRRGRSGSRGL